MAKHLLVVSQCFYPERFRINDICCELVKRGYQVTVLTGIPNYPEGKFYKGYSWFKGRKERWNGIEIIRIPLIARGKSCVGLVCNYFSFVLSGFFWSLFTRVKADRVFTFETSPMTQALISVWYSKRRKIPHDIYVQDLWPENVEIVTGIKNRMIIGPIDRMVDYIYRWSEKILVTSPSFQKVIRARVGEPDKVIYWPQYGEEFGTPRERKAIADIPDDGAFKIVFAGNFGQAQGLQILPETAAVLKRRNVQGVRFVLVGDGRYKETLLAKIREMNVAELFTIVDRQPPERIPEMLAACDAAFISFMNDPLFEKTIPAKLQTYLACAMPIIASAAGETERIIREAGCGVCCPQGDPEALADSILAFKDDVLLPRLAENARKYFLKHFQKKNLMDQLVNEILQLD